MKRKFKLITSVASLCLAVALMAFGVYAATAPSVTVNGSVSFTASNVLASYKVEQNLAKTKDADDAWTSKGEGKFITTTADADAAKTVGLDELKLDDVKVTASYRMTIVSNFDATSKATVKVAVGLPEMATKDGVTEEVTYEDETGRNLVAVEGAYVLAGGETLVVTYTITIDPAIASTFAVENRVFTLNLSRGAKA